MKIKILSGITIALALSACSSNSKTQNNDAAENKTEATINRTETNKNLPSWLSSYMLIKDALVTSNSEEVKKAANQLSSATDVDPTIKDLSTQISQTDNLDEQRAIFEKLSAAAFEIAGKSTQELGLYKQFCPMAFDNKGAFWLSSQEEIMNPYFGDEMLHCGFIEEEL